MTNNTYIEYDQFDVAAVSDATYTTVTNMPFTDLSSMETDGKYSRGKHATFEKDFTLLDGTFGEMTVTPEDLLYPFWSLHMSDADGDFAINPTITSTFTSDHSSVGISIYFEEEYPLKVKVTFYNASDSILSQKEYDVNSLVFYTNNLVNDYRKITIEFTKTKPYRFIKFYYIEYGRTIIFGDDVLKSGSLVTDTDQTSDKIAINTLDFSICDKTDDFNLANPDGLHKTFQKNQALRLYREKDGVKSGYGKFYLKDFQCINNVAQMNAIDIVGLLDKCEFKGKLYENSTAYLILSDIMTAAGLTGISIPDSENYNMIISGMLKKQSCRNALRELLFAMDCVLTFPSYFIVKQSKTVQYTIGRDRKFSTQTVGNEFVSSVSIKYPNYVLNPATVQILSAHYTAGTHKIEFAYPVANLTTSAGVIMTFETFYCVLYLDAASDIIISGNKYNSQEVITTYTDPYIPVGENPKLISFNATLVNAETAQAKAKSILEYYQMGLGITARFANDTENVGDYAIISNPDANYSDFIVGIENMSTDLVGGWISTATCRGYFQKFTEDAYCGEFYCGERGLI